MGCLSSSVWVSVCASGALAGAGDLVPWLWATGPVVLWLGSLTGARCGLLGGLLRPVRSVVLLWHWLYQIGLSRCAIGWYPT